MLWRSVQQRGAGWKILPLLVALSVLNSANLCTGQFPQFPQIPIDAVDRACKLCDDQFGAFLSNLSGMVQGANTDPSLSPLDVGRLFCSQVNNNSNCYKDCIQGYNYQYTSVFTGLMSVAADLCKPTGCDVSYVPSCYEAFGGRIPSGLVYSPSACDPIGSTIFSSLSQCIDRYANQQNCTGTCSTNQRSLKMVKLGQEIACQIPFTSVLCTAAVQICFAQTYGLVGTDFVVGNSLTSASSDDICNQGKTFSTCMTNTLSGNFLIPTGPCSEHSNAIVKLIALSDAIFKPYCDNPGQNFISVCSLESTTSGSGCMKRRR